LDKEDFKPAFLNDFNSSEKSVTRKLSKIIQNEDAVQKKEVTKDLNKEILKLETTLNIKRSQDDANIGSSSSPSTNGESPLKKKKKSKKKNEDSDLGEEDSDIEEMEEMTKELRCPITREFMEDCVKKFVNKL